MSWNIVLKMILSVFFVIHRSVYSTRERNRRKVINFVAFTITYLMSDIERWKNTQQTQGKRCSLKDCSVFYGNILLCLRSRVLDSLILAI